MLLWTKILNEGIDLKFICEHIISVSVQCSSLYPEVMYSKITKLLAHMKFSNIALCKSKR